MFREFWLYVTADLEKFSVWYGKKPMLRGLVNALAALLALVMYLDAGKLLDLFLCIFNLVMCLWAYSEARGGRNVNDA